MTDNINQFDRDTRLSRRSEGVWDLTIADSWHVNVGPNGGYIAALLLKGMHAELGDGHQSRSITIHFLSASVPGEAYLDVQVEKKGRTLSTATARLFQGEKTIAMALATFAPSREIIEFRDVRMPVVPNPDEIPEQLHMNKRMPGHVAFRDHYDQRLAIGPTPPDTSTMARVGGWTRFMERRPLDDIAVLAISDSWFPGLLIKELPEPMHAPTVDHTVHFLRPLPLESMDIDDFLLVEFTTEIAQDGYLIENGSIWSPDGQLVAVSRQLAIIMKRE